MINEDGSNEKLIFEEKEGHQQVTMKVRKEHLKKLQEIKVKTKLSRDEVVEKIFEFALSRIEFK